MNRNFVVVGIDV